ncbi:DUF6907 domain-containing protein [Streptomyces sp. KN37]|uniref:DUF6907 domain-containing protein n=1 Tax=Streptomyces sp. KN37 TaxID=3090667 RepID=UPI002A75F706|nr:hypothetical protein [Streptomyces sp. KN37]WPO69944.1 hypothetical protein R9806_04510 [Streptomyces sp. KN37]
MQNTVTPLATALPELKPGFRLVPAKVGKPDAAQIVWVECPDFCVEDHVDEHVWNVEDISHSGAPAVLNLASDQSAGLPIEVSLSWWPSSDGVASRPCLAVDIDREVAVYGRTGALAVADQIAAFAENVRRLAETLPDETPAPVPSQADEALRRVRGVTA